MAAAAVGRVGYGIPQLMMTHRHPPPPRVEVDTRQLVLLVRRDRLALVRLRHVAHTLHTDIDTHNHIRARTQREGLDNGVSLLINSLPYVLSFLINSLPLQNVFSIECVLYTMTLSLMYYPS
jgi:hypothetical protein